MNKPQWLLWYWSEWKLKKLWCMIGDQWSRRLSLCDGERTEDWWRMWKLPITILLHPPPSHHGNLMSTSEAQRRFWAFWYWQPLPSHSHKGGPFPFLPFTIVATMVSWSSKHLRKHQLVPSEPLFTWFHHGIKGWPEILFTMIIHTYMIMNHDRSWCIFLLTSEARLCLKSDV